MNFLDLPANEVPRPDLGLVVGGAASWEEDLEALSEIVNPWPGVAVAVNDVGTVLDGIHELCTLHHEGRTGRKNTPPAPWAKLRAENGLPPVPVVACANSNAWPIDVTWKARANDSDRAWTDGSSGLYGVARLYLHYGCTKIVLAGVRMDTQSNGFRDEARWAHHGRYWRGWEKRMDRLLPVVRSMSGLTRATFGAPTLEWLGLSVDRDGGKAVNL